jgi:anti-sigma factor RsiW
MTDFPDLDGRGTDLPDACLPMTSLLQPFVDDELAPDDREAVAEHITDCLGCLAEIQQQQTVRAALRQLEPEVIPEALLARIRAELDEVDAELDGVLLLERPSRLRAFARGVGMMVPAAAAAAALFFVVQKGGEGEGASAHDALPMATAAQTSPGETAVGPVPVPEAQGQMPSVAASLPAGIELVGGQPRVGGGAYDYADQRNGLRFRDQLRSLREGRPTGTRQMFRGQVYFLSHDARGRAQVEVEVGDVVHRLVQLDEARGTAPRIELSLDEPSVQRLVVFTHSLHGAKAP